MTIAILCPTRGREKLFDRMCDSAFKTSRNTKIYFYQAVDDFPTYKCPTQKDSIVKCVGSPWPTVQSWNYLSSFAMTEGHNLFMLAADDIIFSTPGWDEALLDHYNNLENKIHVYHLQDSRDVNGTPHPIVTREYIDAMGYFLPPIFMHWYGDTWTVEIAKHNSCFTHLRDYELIHDKPSDKGISDETHSRIRKMGWRERDKYVNDTCQHFLELEKNRLAKVLAA